MDGVIYIRSLSEQEEEILQNFKQTKNIAANTKAIQGIMTEYARLKNSDDEMRLKIKSLNEKVYELENQLEDYQDFFKLFKKLSKNNKS